MFIANQHNETLIQQELASNILTASKTTGKYDLAALHPEYDLTGVYGTFNTDLGLARSLTIFDKVIVKVEPKNSLLAFKQSYKVSLQTFCSLVRAGKILPLICYPYDCYPLFFDELFSISHFPRTGRVRELLYLDTQLDSEKILNKVEQLFKKPTWEVWFSRNISNLHGNSKDIAIQSYTCDLYDFYLLGMPELVELFLELANYDPKLAHKLCADYSKYLVKPLFETLDGINNFTDNDLRSATDMFLKADVIKNNYFVKNKKLVNGIESYLGINPTELIRLFESDLKISLPNNVKHYEMFCESLEKEEDIINFRQSLSSLAKNQFSKDSISSLKEVGGRVSRYIEKDIKRLDRAAGISSWALMCGASITPALMAGNLGNNNETSSLYAAIVGPAAGLLVGDNTEKFHNISKNIVGNTYEKLTSKKIVTTLWKSRQ